MGCRFLGSSGSPAPPLNQGAVTVGQAKNCRNRAAEIELPLLKGGKKTPEWEKFPGGKQDKSIERMKDPETHTVQNHVKIDIYLC